MAVTREVGGCPIFIRSAGILFATTSLTFATMSVNSATDASMLRRCISVGGSEDDSIAAGEIEQASDPGRDADRHARADEAS